MDHLKWAIDNDVVVISMSIAGSAIDHAVTFTIQEPRPRKGKTPKAIKTTKTLIVK